MKVIFDRKELVKNSYIDDKEFFFTEFKTWVSNSKEILHEQIKQALKDKDAAQLIIEINKYVAAIVGGLPLSQKIKNTLILIFGVELEQYLNSGVYGDKSIHQILRESYFEEIRLDRENDFKYINENRRVYDSSIDDLYVSDDWLNSLKRNNWHPSQIIFSTLSHCTINNLYVPRDNAIGFFNRTSSSLSGTNIKNIVYI